MTIEHQKRLVAALEKMAGQQSELKRQLTLISSSLETISQQTAKVATLMQNRR